jgi:tetratricopeptide (TPR) repeat protein
MRCAHVLSAALTAGLFFLSAALPEEMAVEARIKDILAKRKAGQELTPQDKEFLEQNARFLKKAAKGDDPFRKMPPAEKMPGFVEGAPGMGPQREPIKPGEAELQSLLGRLNVVDRAELSAAQQLWRATKHDEAVALAQKTAGKTPDTEAAGVALLMVGRFLMETGKAEEAAKNLRAVTGRAAALAMIDLAEPLMKTKDTPGLLAAFKDLLTSQKNGLDRCRVAKAFLEYLDRVGPDGLAPEQRAELMQVVAASIPYEEAMAAKEELAKEQPPAPPQQQPPPFPGQPMFGPGNPGPMGGFMGGPGAGLPPELMERFRNLRDLPPEQRRETINVLMKEVAGQVKQLEAAGKVEEAKRLKEILERHEQMEGRFKDMKGKGKGRGVDAPRDPADLRAEIKKLEDQGFMDEAKKLRKELEETDRAGADEKF